MAEAMSDLFVWWTSADDWDRANTLLSGCVLPQWPGYLHRSFQVRGMPANLERIVASSEFGAVQIQMVVGTPEHTISVGAVGIVIRAKDVPLVAILPGFLTDTQMNLVSDLALLKADDRAIESNTLGTSLRGAVEVVEKRLNDLERASPASRRQGLSR